MGDRIHPRSDSPPATYVIQLPKDQIYRYPPPENTHRLKNYTKAKKSQRKSCCRCFCCTLLLLIIILIILSGIFYLIVKPQSPKYSINHITIQGFNLTQNSIIPKMNVTITVNNPNGKIGIHYLSASSVNVYYNGISLCNGDLPAFYQGTNNRTVFVTELKGSGIVLANGDRSRLVTQQRQRSVPLSLNVRLPVRMEVGIVKSWTVTLKLKCQLTVDRLTAASRIVANDCDQSVKLW